MKKFTFIMYYKRMVYINQYMAEDVYKAEYLWAENLEEGVKEKYKKEIIEEILEGESPPALLTYDGLKSVWYNIYLAGERAIHMHIVETVL